MATTGAEQKQVRRDPLRHYEHYRRGAHGGSPYAGGSSFMERASEAVARGTETVGFLVISSALILGSGVSNYVIHFLSNSWSGCSTERGSTPHR